MPGSAGGGVEIAALQRQDAAPEAIRQIKDVTK